MESREEELEQCIVRLLEVPELASASEATKAAIADANDVLFGDGTPELREVRDTVVYIGEQVELIRLVLDQLCGEFTELRKAVGKPEKQKRLF
jgi:hypothetical protein